MARGVAPGALKLWFKLIPFFLSAALYLSKIFTFFAPLPLLILGATSGIGWALLAGLTNSGLIYLTQGSAAFQFYLVAFVSLAVVVPYCLKRPGFSLERITAVAWLVQMALATSILLVYASMHGLTPMGEIARVMAPFFDAILASFTPEVKTQVLGTLEPEEWRRQILIELPSAVATIALALTWGNLVLLVRLNPHQILQKTGREARSFQKWKTAEWIVWPAIASWALLLWDRPGYSDVALNVFKFLMAVYAIQGLAILSFCLDAWKIRGFFRTMAYLLALFLMTPLLLSIGFFDQWFDFRAKFRQS